MLAPAKKPVDVLRSMAAPRELVEWVRKMNPDEAVRRAWIDVTRADWMPYLAVLRGISKDTIVRATCACARELGEPVLASPEGTRILAALRDESLASAEQDLDDLRLVMLQHGEANQLPWMFWCRLVLELARATRRGNPLIGVALALRMLASTGGRRAQSDLVARFRDTLVLA
ncbi:MAG TPA: hypothetical protein VFV99_18830 [Kofleriaceae bacterium]|nr:hypothetical protein [Kofleriaceae bacterium]